MARELVNWIKKREGLKDILPLETPLNIKVEPIRSCNFKCIYCAWSSPSHVKEKGAKLSIGLFSKFIEGFNFKDKLKSITFAGLGEPLLNRDLPKMIKMAKECSHEIVLITNGSLLTKSVADDLFDSGLDTVRISLQGLNASDYQKMCGIEFDFEYFLINLSYFYNICKNSTGGGGAKVWVKIPDIVVNTPERQEIFKEIFYDKCDFMTIQSISPVFSGIDYKAIKPDYDSTFFNETKLINVDVCPQPFYTMTLLADGSVSPCCETERICMGNINNVTIYNIWNSATFKQFRYAHLKYSYKNINTCKDCKMPLYFNNSFDNIDSIKEKLLAAYEC